MNRRQRRSAERAAGLDKILKFASKEDRDAIKERRLKAGQELHKRHVEDIANKQIKADRQRRINRIQFLIESGMSELDAINEVDIDTDNTIHDIRPSIRTNKSRIGKTKRS